MAHFNFVISRNAKWGHAGFYIDCHRMTVPEIFFYKKALLQSMSPVPLERSNSSGFQYNSTPMYVLTAILLAEVEHYKKIYCKSWSTSKLYCSVYPHYLH